MSDAVESTFQASMGEAIQVLSVAAKTNKALLEQIVAILLEYDSLVERVSQAASSILYELGNMGDPDTPEVAALREVAEKLHAERGVSAETRADILAQFQRGEAAVTRATQVVSIAPLGVVDLLRQRSTEAARTVPEVRPMERMLRRMNRQSDPEIVAEEGER